MRVAFYAPMKSPNSPVPSGDRRVARALIAALKFAGHMVEIASEFQSREPQGVPELQEKLRAQGQIIAAELINQYRERPMDERPDIWFTYHLYYKAMDWIGPIVAKALAIPYVAAEVSYASKRADGPWDMSHRTLGDILQKADTIISLNSFDDACVLPQMQEPSRLVTLKPFMEMSPPQNQVEARADLIAEHRLENSIPIMVTVGMMREGDKLLSYEVLGKALKLVENKNWQLLVVGDGYVRPAVEANLGHERVYYLGELDEKEISPVLTGSDFFVWPAINEAYGMAMLEAQIAGLPVIAGRTGGVGDIVRDGETGLLSEIDSAEDFADKIDTMLSDTNLRKILAKNALEIARQEHSIESAAEILDRTLRGLIK